MIAVIIIAIILTFLVTLSVTPWFIKFLRAIGLVVKDQNKKSKPLIPVSGGLAVLVGFMVGVLFLILFSTFLPEISGHLINPANMSLVFASLLSLCIIVFIGILDDLLIRKDKNESIGFTKQWQKPLLTLVAAIPLIVINAGHHTMIMPWGQAVNFGWVFAIILIPIGVVGAANMVNMFAGYNGVEAGMGVVYITMLGIYAAVNNVMWVAVLAFILTAALLAFLVFNKYPSKIFPGDSLTYLLGAMIVIIAIAGNLERAAIIAAIPFYIEFILKARGKFKKQSYGKENSKGKIENLYGKSIYSIPHIFTRTGKFTEKQIVWFMILIQIVFSCLIWAF